MRAFPLVDLNVTRILLRLTDIASDIERVSMSKKQEAVMKNVIISMIAKISKMDAEAKLLTAQVEAQSLLLSAMLLTLGKQGGADEMVESVKKAINAALDSSDSPLKTDAELLLTQFNELLSITTLLETKDPEINLEALQEIPSLPSDNKST